MAKTATWMRILHRNIGFFLAGIMGVYAVSGIVLVFRNTDFLKQEKIIEKSLKSGLSEGALGKEIGQRDLIFEKRSGDTAFFKGGTYNMVTGAARYSKKELPFVMDKLTKLHKANTKSPLYFFNIFFGVSLFFFVVSAFWMYRPKTTIFKRGLVYALAGVILLLIMLFV